VNLLTMEVAVKRSCVRGRFGAVKTDASGRPVPLHPIVRAVLLEWREASPYSCHEDFLFPSLRLNGKAPLMPDMVLKKIIRPALEKAAITGKVIGWHSFRHSLATNLRSLGVDVKVAQELSDTRTHASRWTFTPALYRRISIAPVGCTWITARRAGTRDESLIPHHPLTEGVSLSVSRKLLFLLSLWRGRRGSNPRPLP
jgi:hypothetical protein